MNIGTHIHIRYNTKVSNIRLQAKYNIYRYVAISVVETEMNKGNLK